MARLARVVVPGLPHHITQRGNRRQQTFFCDEDYEYYLELMGQWCTVHQVEIWAYCLMPNHVHLIAVPQSPDGLRLAIGEVHRRYTRMVNFREGWRGHLWQGRFASFVLDEPYVLTAARYVELNPVRGAGRQLPDPLSVEHARLPMCEDRTTHSFRSFPCSSWRHLGVGFSRGSFGKRTSNSCVLTSGPVRALGDEEFLRRRSKKTSGRILRRQKPGPKPRPARNPKQPTRRPQPQRRTSVWCPRNSTSSRAGRVAKYLPATASGRL